MANYIPAETVEPRMPTRSVVKLPSGACDTHCHVFGPFKQFPFVTPSSYPPPLAPFELYGRMLKTVGLQRGVLVQTAPYGTDPSSLIDALQQGEGRIKGIGVATSEISDVQLENMNENGVVGLRFNEMADPTTGLPYKGSVGIDHFKSLAPRMADLGWHAQIWGNVGTCVRLAKELVPFGIPLVFEHMTSFNVENGVDDPTFRELLTLLGEGRIWVKLALCRVSKAFPDYEDARPFHDALIQANRDRLVWASDWPHVRLGEKTPDVSYLLELFHNWVGDDALFEKILVDNPARLYGFSQKT